MQILGRECVYYFHDMILEMIKWGFQEGKTLFGFGYDFRQSNRYLVISILDCSMILVTPQKPGGYSRLFAYPPEKIDCMSSLVQK